MNKYDRLENIMMKMEGGDLESQSVDQMDLEMNPQPLQRAQAPQGVGSNQQMAGQGMMMTGNPYLMAAGFGLQAMGSAKDRQMKREAQNVNNEIARREKVMSLMSQLGSGIGSIG